MQKYYLSEPAGIFRRVGAYILDVLVVGMILGLCLLPLMLYTDLCTFKEVLMNSPFKEIIISEAEKGPTETMTTALGLIIISFYVYFKWIIKLSYFLYFVVLESSKWQASLGKKAMNLRVSDRSGNRMSIFRACARYALWFAMIDLPFIILSYYNISSIEEFGSLGNIHEWGPLLIYAICVIPMFFTKDKLCIYDMLSKTKVLHEEEYDVIKG